MSGYWSVFRREVDERRLLLLGALVLGGLPFVFAWLPKSLGSAPERLELALVLALIGTAVTAVGVGASVIARDLAERRLGFYFQRPLSGWAIWAGKFSAAAGLSLAAGALMALPAVLADLSHGEELSADGRVALGGLGALLAVLGLTHAGSVILRARSPWLLLDLAGALGVTGILIGAFRHLLRMGAGNPFPQRTGEVNIVIWGLLALAAALLVALLAAGAVQVASARTDLRRGHGALSLTLWCGMLAAAFLFSGFALWVTWVTPADLRGVLAVKGAPAGPWIAVAGPAAHRTGYYPTFLLDTTNGRFVTPNGGGGWPQLSADGRHAVWLEAPLRSVSDSRLALVRLDLADPQGRPISTPLSFSLPPRALAVSPAGDRVAAVEGDRLQVYELPNARIVASVSLPHTPGWLPHLRFLADGRVRLYRGNAGQQGGPKLLSGSSYDVFDLELGGRPVLVWLSHLEAQVIPDFEISPDGRYLFAKSAGRPVVFDVESGRQALDLSPPAAGIFHSQFVFLADGRAVQVLAHETSRDLRIFGPDLREQRRIRMAGDFPLKLGGLFTPGHLVVAQTRNRSTEPPPEAYDAVLVDLATGGIRPLGHGLVPFGHAWAAGPESRASQLFLRGHGLVRIDPRDGRETAIVPTGPDTRTEAGARS